MADTPRPYEYALTRAEYDALMAERDRPLTDPPIGGSAHSARKRAIDAELSAIVTPNNGYTPPRKEKN